MCKFSGTFSIKTFRQRRSKLSCSRYAGALDIQVQGGPVISIPNDVLVVPDEYVDKSGTVQRNNSAAVLLLSPNDGPNINDQLIVGMSFFSDAYLSVNHEEKTSTVWAAKATTDESIVAFGDGCGNGTTSVRGGRGGGLDTSGKEPKGSEPKRMTMAMKIGIAIGASSAAVLLIGLAVWFIIKKRRQTAGHRLPEPTETMNTNKSWSRDYATKPGVAWAMQELAGPYSALNELDTRRTPAVLGGWRDDKRDWKLRGERSEAVELSVMRL